MFHMKRPIFLSIFVVSPPPSFSLTDTLFFSISLLRSFLISYLSQWSSSFPARQHPALNRIDNIDNTILFSLFLVRHVIITMYNTYYLVSLIIICISFIFSFAFKESWFIHSKILYNIWYLQNFKQKSIIKLYTIFPEQKIL